MQKKVLLAIANGSEEMEAIIPIDVLRRAGAEVTIAATALQITAAHGTRIVADTTLEKCIDNTYDLIIIPGGMPGAEHLRDNASLTKMLKTQNENKRLIAAICAAPVVVLQHHGLLEGKRATCHPSMFSELKNLSQDPVVIDSNVITSQGPGTATAFALRLTELLFDQETRDKVAKSMVI